ncbi:MAG: hypothetical protein PHO91_01665 [Patescibacteria group bacterium]|nr:hypothetical protein [Patescibacteria group bacterium]
MFIKDLALYFDRQEQDKTYFKDQAGREIAIDSGLLLDYSEKSKLLYLSLSSQKQAEVKAKEILNEILKD